MVQNTRGSGSQICWRKFSDEPDSCHAKHCKHVLVTSKFALVSASDINECEMGNGGCAHGCRNNDGSFECYCDEGYSLDRNGITCRGRCRELASKGERHAGISHTHTTRARTQAHSHTCTHILQRSHLQWFSFQ